MLHFSDCRKETQRLENGMYDIQLWYEAQDETEILIRILSFGPMLKVTEPSSFIALIKNRISMQQTLADVVANS
jgi:predicted DNA-binding transcriptional regulator YafY